ncbi:MAG: hypothetical protein ACLFT4_09520, partial [Bacteroidales bacterium]
EKPKVICAYCGDSIAEDQATNYHDQWLCPDCNGVVKECVDCHKLFDIDDLNESPDGELRCDDCFTELYAECDYCGRLINRHAEYYMIPDTGRYTGDLLCDRCYEEMYTSCDNCGEELDREEALIGNAGQPLCTMCYEEEDQNDHRIIAYHCFEGDWKFHGNGPRFYGLEIEIEARHDIEESADAVRDNFNSNEVIMMEDGSISGDGFEIITHPADLENVRKFAERLGNLTDTCKGFHAKSCGMHIHFNKKSVSELQLAKFLLFFANNKEFIEFIGQRPQTEYWKHENVDSITDKIKNPSSYERYEAINLGNDKTIEVRVFQSNLRTDRVMKNVLFIESLLQFCNEFKLENMSKDKYKEFLIKNHNKYKEVYDYVHNNS